VFVLAGRQIVTLVSPPLGLVARTEIVVGAPSGGVRQGWGGPIIDGSPATPRSGAAEKRPLEW
jgi:hypothetical protein